MDIEEMSTEMITRDTKEAKDKAGQIAIQTKEAKAAATAITVITATAAKAGMTKTMEQASLKCTSSITAQIAQT